MPGRDLGDEPDEPDEPEESGSEPLETLPPPGREGEDNDYKVGPGHPPLPSRWEKGGPSPNPYGRPPKAEAGPVHARLAQKRVVTIEGVRKPLTERELLDRVVLQKAQLGNLSAMKLFAERQKVDEQIREQHAREISSRQSAHISETSRKLAAEIRVRDALYNAIQTACPGLLDALEKLQSAGASRIVGNRVEPADWLNLPRRS